MRFQIKEKRIRFGGYIYTITRKKLAFATAAGLCICVIIGSIINYNAKKTPVTAFSISPAPKFSETAKPSEPSISASSKAPDFLLHITGAVKNPGLVRLRPDARVADAIEAAGGFADFADPESLNLASPVSDGMKLYVPRHGETAGIFLPATPDTPGENGSNIKININTAGIAELISLDGIGESIAKKIIAYREENGKFQKTEDLLQVSGIGNSKYKNIQDRICV